MVMATMADAHREWHRNTGVPMGHAGCPEDACDGPYYDEDDHPDPWWVKEPDPVYLVVTPYGTETYLNYPEAALAARSIASVLGRTIQVKKV